MGFIRAVLRGVCSQIKRDQRGLYLLGAVGRDEDGSPGPIPREDDDDIAFDDVSGDVLDPSVVKKARAEELSYYKKMEAYAVVPVEECWNVPGRPPIGVRWIDHDKGDSSRPSVRCRLVAQDYKSAKDEDLFAGTPPLEALKVILSSCVTGTRTKCIMINDISRV